MRATARKAEGIKRADLASGSKLSSQRARERGKTSPRATPLLPFFRPSLSAVTEVLMSCVERAEKGTE